ncbi:adenylate kinase 7 isoform X2 [Cephus cinctus]|uniref:Adenylate kinase 7 isoform X2 n=1 Tax=Cephus cinctus TaxID=211228 RepID=A0AAJ7W5L4_CEPCN|nr:adenylate kinase 7 isoform X2 [Cephus cinctus]
MSLSRLNVSRASTEGADNNPSPSSRPANSEPSTRRLTISENETQFNESNFVPWRIFVNQLDSYHGKKLADFLPEQLYLDKGKSSDGLDEAEDEDEEETEEVEDEDEKFNVPTKGSNESPRNFQVIGTVMDREIRQPEDVTMIIRHPSNRESYLKELMKCGIIIFDVTLDNNEIDEARWAFEAVAKELEKIAENTPKAFKRIEDVRYFILISSVMTWSLTKPLDPEDPELPFTEVNYRKRKAHPNFKEHIQLEKDVLAANKNPALKDKFKTIVLCSGITYGDEQDILHYLFKMAWENSTELPIFGKGRNKIPLLHVRDLVTTVYMLIRKWPSLKYIVAVEQELISQRTIVKRIARALSTGKVKHIVQEEAFLLPDVNQRNYDAMTINLRIEPAYIINQNISWNYEMPFKNNMAAIVKEYKMARNLHPIKIIVLGPPAAGKTRIAHQLANHYRIPYVFVKTLITDTIQKLANEVEIARSRKVAEEVSQQDKVKENPSESPDEDQVDEEEEEEEEEDNDEDEIPDVESLQEELNEMRNNLAHNNGRLSDDILNKIFFKRLLAKDCQNQGYVIDGYPKTLEQAKSLFGIANDDEPEAVDDEEEEDEVAMLGGNTKIMPEFVIALEACDEFLIERLINRPEKEIQNTHYTEEHMMRRLLEYRQRNTEDNTPLEFFDELDIHPLIISIENETCPDMFETFVRCIKKIGKPRNYGPSAKEVADARKRTDSEAFAAATIQREREAIEDFARRREREEKMMEWTNLLEKLKEEEEEQLCILGEPLRNYLMKYVFPTLTQGLIEVAKLRPEDPVDFLASGIPVQRKS